MNRSDSKTGMESKSAARTMGSQMSSKVSHLPSQAQGYNVEEVVVELGKGTPNDLSLVAIGESLVLANSIPGHLAQASPLGKMASHGTAQSSERTKSVALESFNKFTAASKGLYPGAFIDLRGNVVCHSDIWCEYAFFAVESLDLKSSTIVEYMRKAMQKAKELHAKAFPEFFAFLDEPIGAKNWFKGVVLNVAKKKFQEAVADGERMADQAQGIYVADREEIARSYRLHGTAESQMKNSVIQINGVAAGRPCESLHLNRSTMSHPCAQVTSL